jgi:glyoxylase-like metal-dependent hydrolase (beta-lactamase superfamily II)
MKITRRALFASAAVSLALPLAARKVWASSSLDLGGMRLQTLSDGHLTLPGDFILGGMPQEEMAEIVARHGLPTDVLSPPCNVTLLRDGDSTVLFDVGAGPDFQDSAGRLPEALAAAGVSPEEITHVLVTHAHPDHLWGLLDDFDEPLFPDAALMIGRAEFDYWTDPATPDSIGEARTAFAVGAARRLQAVEASIRLIEEGEEVLPGVIARLTPGHTPGHMAYEVGGRAMVAGDAIGNHHVAFERPDWPSGSDQDPELAADTRVALLERLAAEDMALVGFHLPDGGIGRVARDGGAFRFEAAA